MKIRLVLILALGLFLCACAPKAAPTVQATPPAPTLPATVPPTPLPPFVYDASIPFDTRINSQTEQNGVVVVDLSYAAHDAAFSPATGGRTLAYLIKPQGNGPFAGLIYLHWQLGGRTQFMDEAVAFAKHGAVCLLLQGYFPWMSAPTGATTDRDNIIGQITELRRAIDFLVAQPGVDAGRLGFAGHDYGAIYGGVLAGVDPRIQNYVLTAGAPSFSNWIGFSNVKPDVYVKMVGDLDPINFVPNAAPANIFFQFGEQDGIISHDLGTSFFEAASDPKQVAWYDDVHGMTNPAVSQGRVDWLIEKMQLNP